MLQFSSYLLLYLGAGYLKDSDLTRSHGWFAARTSDVSHFVVRYLLESKLLLLYQ